MNFEINQKGVYRVKRFFGRLAVVALSISSTDRLHHCDIKPIHRKYLALDFSRREDACAGSMFQSGQLVRVNLAGLQAEGVMFQAAVTDAVGHIVKQTSEQPPKYLVKLLFSFRGVSEVEVPADRIHADK